MNYRRAYGSGSFTHQGYLVVYRDGRRIPEHRYVAEKAIGKALPRKAVVHHWDEDKANNENENLLVCPDRAYHNLIHARMDAFKATGDPNQIKCKICGRYDFPINLSGSARKDMSHKVCMRDRTRAMRSK